jgi:hypothetical protein
MQDENKIIMPDTSAKPFFGNAQELGSAYRGWFMGPFLPGDHPCRSEDVEVKWHTHPKGDCCDWKEGYESATLSVLVSGEFEEEFEGETFVLKDKGDFIFFGPGIKHRWRALEESIVFTVRWRS